MVLTFWCILVTIGSLFFFGLPVAEWLADREADRERVWITAPFVGLGIIILALQNLVYLDVRIGISTPWLWVAGLALWVWLAKTGRISALFSAMPRALFLAMLAVYLAQGIGLVVIGAKYYVARGWIDQFNYTAIAHFLSDYPFSLSYEAILNQPILIKALTLKWDRIGVMIFQGFLSTSSFADPKTVFEPAILLAPALVVLSVYELARRFKLPARHVAFAAVAAGVLPAITTVQVETFFSQALGIPILLILPCFVFDLAERFTWKRLLGGALILAAGTTIYTEFHVIFLGIIGLIFCFEWFRSREKLWSYVFSAFSLVGASLALNIGFIYHVYDIFNRLAVADVLAGIYPWAFSLDGISRLWLGDVVLALQSPGWFPTFYQAWAVALLLIAYLGLGFALWRQRDSLTLSVTVLAILPFTIRIQGTQYPYQFYKLLLSVSPLLLLGVAAFVNALESTNLKIMLPAKRVNLGMIGLVILLCLCTAGTTIVGGIFPFGIRSIGAAHLLSPGARQVQDVLSSIRENNVLIVCKDGYMNAWLAYFARHNHVWVAYPILSDISVEGRQSFANLPGDIFVLACSPDDRFISRSTELVWSADPYRFWKITENDWALLLDIKNANGVEEWNGETAIWLGQGDTEVYVVSSKEGRLTITGEFTRGPSLPDVPERQLAIATDDGYSATIAITNEGMQSFSVPVIAGPNRIILRSLDKPSVTELLNGDARPLLLGIRGLGVNLGERNR